MLLFVKRPSRDDRDEIELLVDAYIEACPDKVSRPKKGNVGDRIKETFLYGCDYPFPLPEETFESVREHVLSSEHVPERIEALYEKFAPHHAAYRQRLALV